MRLSKVFSDGALYLHSAPLEIRGRATAGASLSARILRGGEVLSEGKAVADREGNFAVPLFTPAASLSPAEIEISDGIETVTLSDVLFGELWLACGQSNMEMSNDCQPEWESEMIPKLAGKAIRVFTARRLPNDGQYPFEPQTDTDGWWVSCENSEKMAGVSALATAFSSDLYEYLKGQGSEIPVGFCNCNRGGTNLETWLPAETFERYEALRGLGPKLENWNQNGNENHQQPSGYYNLNTHPHLGIKARGMLWYQGESNLVAEQRRPLYREMMIALRETYRELFSPSEDELFPIFSAEIYPWMYRSGSDACIGYFNRVFSELAKDDPLRYPYLPLCDLSPIWRYHVGNSPIHPAHKYALGSRFALLVENHTYGRRGQRLPASLSSCVRHGERLRLVFSDVGSGLSIKDGVIRGLYVRSDKGAYHPAKCEIEGKRVLWVWNEGVKRPRHVAYAVSTHEFEATLWAGEFPVAPFCTEFSDSRRNIEINRKNWLDLSRDGEFVISKRFAAPLRDAGYLPLFYPLPGTLLGFDPISTGKRGLRLVGEGARFGAYVPARNGAALDLWNYRTLSFTFYSAGQVEPSLVLDYAEQGGRQTTLTLAPAEREKLPFGRERITFDLASLPEGEIERMTFAFRETKGALPLAVIDEISILAKC